MVLCAVLLVSLVFSIEVVGTSNTQQDTGRGEHQNYCRDKLGLSCAKLRASLNLSGFD